MKREKKGGKKTKKHRKGNKNGGNIGALIPSAILLGTRQYLLKNKGKGKKFKFSTKTLKKYLK